MFTGIVDALGRIDAVHVNNGVELRVKASYKGVKKGESIALNGACLTVEKVLKGAFTVHAVQTTLGRTLIGEWKKGRSVNLERALRAGDRFGGHFVQGHVDGVGTVAGVAEVEDAMLVDIRVPPDVEETTVLHGAITVDGVSTRWQKTGSYRCRSCRSHARTRRWGGSAAVTGCTSRPTCWENM